MRYRGKERMRGAAKRDADGDDDEGHQGACCGLRWKPLLFLFLFVGPALLGALLKGSEWIMSVTGVTVPEFMQARPPGPDHRARLLAFYRQNNPGKIGEVDGLLEKYKGKEQKLFRKLEQKYKKLT
eukprot:jgi/Tetstr1/458255/TSEL_044743.t1